MSDNSVCGNAISPQSGLPSLRCVAVEDSAEQHDASRLRHLPRRVARPPINDANCRSPRGRRHRCVGETDRTGGDQGRRVDGWPPLPRLWPHPRGQTFLPRQRDGRHLPRPWDLVRRPRAPEDVESCRSPPAEQVAKAPRWRGGTVAGQLHHRQLGRRESGRISQWHPMAVQQCGRAVESRGFTGAHTRKPRSQRLGTDRSATQEEKGSTRAFTRKPKSRPMDTDRSATQ